MSVIDQNASRFAARAKTGVVSLFSSADDTARFTAHWHRPSAVLVRATGEIDAVNANHLAEYATRYLDGHRTLVLDLQGLRFSEPMGWWPWIGCDATARYRGSTGRSYRGCRHKAAHPER